MTLGVKMEQHHSHGAGLHAILLPVPAMGHINPIIYLAGRLVSVGFSLTIINSEPFHKLLQEAWQPPNPKIRLLSVPDPLHGQIGAAHLIQFTHSPQLQFIHDVQLLLEQIKQDISCIIFDPFLHWVPDLAEQFGVPCVGFWTGSVISHVITGEVHRLLQQGLIPVKKIAATRASAPEIDDIPGLSCPFNAFDLPSALQENYDCDPDYKFRILRYNQMKRASWVLANTFEELEADALQASRIDIPNFIAVGPLLSAKALRRNEEDDLPMVGGLWEADQTCLKWLDTQKPSSVLYISFGSLANLEEEQVLQLACGIELSKQPFLWVCRTNLIAGSCKNLLDEFMSKTKDRGLVINWAPQIEVLQHPCVGGFLTHCGWNSILEGICAGVPMLGWPCLAEQPINCRFVADVWKIGVRLCDNDIVEKTQVARKIRRLMVEEESKEIRGRVQQLNVAATAASSSKQLEVFAGAMRTHIYRDRQTDGHTDGRRS